MNDDRPFLLVRAKPLPDEAERFARWFREVHIRDAGQIPGVAQVRSGRTPGGAWLAMLIFANSEAVQQALSSPEAQYARGTWAQWAGKLDELHIEIFAALGAMPIFRSRS